MKIAALTAIATRQYGCISAQQALEIMSRGQFEYLITEGVLRRVHPETYVVNGFPKTWHQRAMAATLSIPGSMLSYQSAARMWGLTFVSNSGIHITVPRAGAFRRKGVTVHRSEQLDSHSKLREGIPVTSVARTLIDISRSMSVGQLGAVFDQACNLGLLKIQDVEDCLSNMVTVGRARVTVIRAVLAERNIQDEKAESFLERKVLQWIRSSNFPEPEAQYWVGIAGKRYRLDFAYPDAMTAIEVDGPHHLLLSVVRADRKRNAALEAAGWLVLHVDLDTSPDEFIALLRPALHRRGDVTQKESG